MSLRTRVARAVRTIADPGRIYRRMRLRYGSPVFDFQTEGVGVYLYPGEHVSWHIIRCSFEPAVRKIFAHVVQPGWTIFDVGANLGFYAAIAGRLVGPSGRVYAFEPSQRESQRAEKTLLANGLMNVELYRTAVGDADGEVCLNVCEADFAAYNSIGTVTHPEAVGHTSHQERVGCRALDSFVAEKQLRRVDLVKIDVEGAEELVLRGAQKLLSSSDAPLVLSEIPTLTAPGVGSSAKAVLDLLRQYGYIVYAIFDYGDTYELRRQPAEDSIMPGEVIAFKSCHAPFLRGTLRGIGIGEGPSP